MDLMGLVSRFTKQGTGASLLLRQTVLQSLAVAEVEPPFAELARSGRRFGGGCQVIANGIAPDTAIPTTTAKLALYNSDPNKAIYVDSLGYWLGSGTAAAGSAMLVGLSQGPIASAPSMAANYAVASLSHGGLASKAIWGTAVTLIATVAWFQINGNMQLAAANVGQSGQPNGILGGGICIPPLHALGIAILSAAGTSPLYQVSGTWTESETDLE